MQFSFEFHENLRVAQNWNNTLHGRICLPCDVDSLSSSRDLANPPMQDPGQNGDYLMDKWLQFLKTVADGEHDNDRNWQVIEILLVRYPSIICDQGIKVMSCCQSKQCAINRYPPNPSVGPYRPQTIPGKMLSASEVRTHQAKASFSPPASIALACSSTAMA